LAATLERWFLKEWMPWYGPDGPGDARADLAACANLNALPLCVVALSSDDDLLGTASLRSESVGSDIADGPWLAAVLVAKAHQGRGVGGALVAAIEAEAARLGFASLYTSTDTAQRILIRRGWTEIGTSESLRGAVSVYRWRNDHS
jgi:GNAT superfamily N-acetyltransferase